jgi:hypothetical protein
MGRRERRVSSLPEMWMYDALGANGQDYAKNRCQLQNAGERGLGETGSQEV